MKKETTTINYEASIKSYYKNAWIRTSFDGFYFLYDGTELICEGEASSSSAWQSAYNNLKQQGTL